MLVIKPGGVSQSAGIFDVIARAANSALAKKVIRSTVGKKVLNSTLGKKVLEKATKEIFKKAALIGKQLTKAAVIGFAKCFSISKS